MCVLGQTSDYKLAGFAQTNSQRAKGKVGGLAKKL